MEKRLDTLELAQAAARCITLARSLQGTEHYDAALTVLDDARRHLDAVIPVQGKRDPVVGLRTTVERMIEEVMEQSQSST